MTVALPTKISEYKYKLDKDLTLCAWIYTVGKDIRVAMEYQDTWGWVVSKGVVDIPVEACKPMCYLYKYIASRDRDILLDSFGWKKQ